MNTPVNSTPNPKTNNTPAQLSSSSSLIRQFVQGGQLQRRRIKEHYKGGSHSGKLEDRGEVGRCEEEVEVGMGMGLGRYLQQQGGGDQLIGLENLQLNNHEESRRRFLTSRDQVQNNLNNQHYNTHIPHTHRPHTHRPHTYSPLTTRTTTHHKPTTHHPSTPYQQPTTQQPPLTTPPQTTHPHHPTSHHPYHQQQQHLHTRQLITSLSQIPTSSSPFHPESLWLKFLHSVTTIKNTQEELCLTNVNEKNKQNKLLTQIMKETQFLLDQHTHRMQATFDMIHQKREVQLKEMLVELHGLSGRWQQAKRAIEEHRREYEGFLGRVKEEEDEKRLALVRKREMAGKLIVGNNENNSNTNTGSSGGNNVKNSNTNMKNTNTNSNKDKNTNTNKEESNNDRNITHKDNNKKDYSYNKLQSHHQSPLRYMSHCQINIHDKEVRKVMQKKSKLNLQLDLSFQLQHRKKITQQKSAFNQQTLKLQRSKFMLETTTKQLKQRIEFKEKQIQRYQLQLNKQQKEREYFLRMMVKHVEEYRLDGLMWVWKHMLESGLDVQIGDFSDSLDAKAKLYLIEEFRLAKQKGLWKKKSWETGKGRGDTMRNKGRNKGRANNNTNRIRVKSVIVFKSEQEEKKDDKQPIGFSNFSNFSNNNNLDMSPGSIKNPPHSINPPSTSINSLFSFGSSKHPTPTLTKPTPCIPSFHPSTRKKSFSMTTLHPCLPQHQLPTHSSENPSSTQHHPSFKPLIHNQTNQKKIYQSTKKYLKNWVNNQGWNVLGVTTARLKGKKVQQEAQVKGVEEFVKEEKIRTKANFFKVGRQNLRYKAIVKAIYGGETGEGEREAGMSKKTCMTTRRVNTCME